MFAWMMRRLLRPFGASGEAVVVTPHVVCVTGADRRVVSVTGYTGGPGCR